jgi:hypothetical protein
MASTHAFVVRLVRIAGLAAVFASLVAVSPVLAVCGDGILDAGEACDDGSQNNSANSCCSTSCTFNGRSPDVIVGDVTGVTRHGNVGGITAYSVGTTSCNLGSCWLNWIAGTSEHPVIGQNMFRLKDGRFEHVGQSWLKHGYTALSGTVCSTSCVPTNGTHLGVNCSDPYGSSLNGDQTRLGPKTDVNAATGVFLYPDSRISTTGNAIFKRLQVHDVDLNPTLNVGALYFVEGQYVTRDDAAAKHNANNNSYRRVSVGAAPTFTLTYVGTVQQQLAGIQAWKANDAAVDEVVAAGNDGFFIVSSKATSLGGGLYHYEYAVQNVTNNQGAQSFTVPLPAGTTVTNVGFHDVDYHSGDPYDLTDWTSTVTAGSVVWATTPYATNVNANALRWGTLYNFRFDANVAPGSAEVFLGMFKPGAQSTIKTTTVVPGPCTNGPNGLACDDHNPCTSSDACASGLCVGAPVVCAPIDACHAAGSCNTGTGLCSNPTRPDGSPCDDGSACTQTDGCMGGTCAGGNPVVCSALDECHDPGACNPASGACSNPERPEGSPCGFGDLCVSGASCVAGSCSGGTPVVCNAQDDCHEAGLCDTQTGNCSNPVRPDGATCDDANACTAGDACTNGVCAGIGPQVPQDLGDVLSVDRADGMTTLSWTPASPSPTYSVLRGLVAELPVGPGAGDEQCLESGVAGTSTLDPEDPASDTAFWYLVRGVNGCGAGPYGDESVGGAPAAPRQSSTCP